MSDDSKRWNKCPNCDWPICSSSCSRMAIHAENECKIFSAKKIPYPPPPPLRASPPSIICDCITLIRGMGVKGRKDEKIYKQLMSLQGTFQVAEFNKKLQRQVDLFLHVLENLIGGPLENPELVDEYKKIAGLKKVNAFAGFLNESDHFKSTTFGKETASHIYLKASFFNHSCVPNCSWNIGPFPDLRIRIRTILPVKKGEELTHSYIGRAGSELGTFRRQLSIRNGFGFICTCPRCLDPSELNTFSSAVACPKCRPMVVPVSTSMVTVNGGNHEKSNQHEVNDDHLDGYLLPVDPLNLDPGATFQCNSCKLTIPSGELRQGTLIDKLATQLECYSSKMGEHQGVESGSRKIDQFFYENFIQKYGQQGSLRVNINEEDEQDEEERNGETFAGGKFNLHPNHWLLQKATVQLITCHMTTHQSSWTRRSDLDKSIKSHLYLLNIQDQIAPGYSKQRVWSLRNLAAVLLTLLTKWSSTMSEREARYWTKLCKRIQAEVLEFYKMDLDESMDISK